MHFLCKSRTNMLEFTSNYNLVVSLNLSATVIVIYFTSRPQVIMAWILSYISPLAGRKRLPSPLLSQPIGALPPSESVSVPPFSTQSEKLVLYIPANVYCMVAIGLRDILS